MRWLALLTCICNVAYAIDAHDTRLLEQPDIDQQHVVFVYDNDLWIAPRDGGAARRLTTAPGVESAPHFSADGQLLAFSADYDGNVDVYVMPVAGGAPTRLTWHSAPDTVQGFLPDGRILFSSTRNLHTDRMMQLFAVPVSGGMPERLPVPDGDDAQVAPDGSRIAYSTMPPAYKNSVPQAKNYRGGDASRIWLMDLGSYAVQQVPRPAGRCNDLNPVWLDGLVYFTSDRNGEFNLYSFDPRSTAIEQLTRYEDFPVLNLNDGDGRLVYEQAGTLHVFDRPTRNDRRLVIAAGSDLRETRPRYVSNADYVRAVAPSPDLSSVALEYRGEIVVLPLDGAPYRNLTRSTGANDRSPAWSADGRQIAWFSDLSGEYALYICTLDCSGPRRLELHGAGFYEDLQWSPDGRYLSYLDNSRSLYVVDAQTGTSSRIAQEPEYASANSMRHSWAPDSRRLVYTINEHGMVQTVYVYSLDKRRAERVSDPLVDTGEPVFDPSGTTLYVAASVDAGPVRDWFTQSRLGMKITRTLYAIDLRGSTNRAVQLPGTTGTIRNVKVARSGELYYLVASEDGDKLIQYSRSAGAPQSLLEDVSDYAISADGSRILYRKHQNWMAAPLAARIDESAARALPTGNISVLIEPVAEWRQILHESWRIKRDFFYAPNLHGANWDAIWAKYEPFLTHAATRNDVARIQYWMSAEVAVGHSYVLQGPPLEQPARVSVGLLGVDFTAEGGRYRFAKIYGSHWTPSLAAPLADAGVVAGEYLLKIGDSQVAATDDVYRFLQNVVGRSVALTVGPRPDLQGARTITVMPVEDETMLRRIDWIEDNIRKVDAASGGRVAYVHLPDTAGYGLALFRRYFYPQSHKQAIVLDARFNGGGSFGDGYVDVLRRELVGNFATRYGDDLRVPRGAILGPKVLITNQMARSGGDLFAYLFRKLQLGPIVGTTTTGALVGNIGVPELLDGGTVTAPNFGFWTAEEGWVVENTGVAPDVEIEQWPSAVNAEHDPQLEQAVATALELLQKSAPAKASRPAYPIRVR